jgi:hypothetical protein
MFPDLDGERTLGEEIAVMSPVISPILFRANGKPRDEVLLFGEPIDATDLSQWRNPTQMDTTKVNAGLCNFASATNGREPIKAFVILTLSQTLRMLGCC